MMVAKITEGFETFDAAASGDVLWRIDDRYGRAEARRIFDTKFAMVYGEVDGVMEAMRPVSDRYRPVPTGALADLLRSRLDDEVLQENVRYDRHNTRIRVRLAIDSGAIKLAPRPFDAGSRWVAHGRAGLQEDLIYPMVEVVNSYDASTAVSASVGFWRLVCANGLMLPAFPGSCFFNRRMHTINEVDHLFKGAAQFAMEMQDMAAARNLFKGLMKRRLTGGEREKIGNMLPKEQREHFVEHAALGQNRAMAAVNFLSYLQSHEVSLTRGPALQPIIDHVVKLAARGVKI